MIEETEKLHNAENEHNTDLQEVVNNRGIVSVQSEIENLNTEEHENSSVEDKVIIPAQDYDLLSMEELTEHIEKLVNNFHIEAIKNHVEEIRKAFLHQYHNFISEKRSTFEAENTDEQAEFDYHFPLKNKFDTLYNGYKIKRNDHSKQIQKQLEQNLTKRNELIDRLKNLIDNTDEVLTISDKFNRLNEIRKEWNEVGAIPKDTYNIVWNNFHFHTERFYDLIHLDKEARDQDFKHNLEQKQAIIQAAKELLEEKDILKSFKELHLLHRKWKEETGPVAREHRETIWEEFISITKILHTKRDAFFAEIKAREAEHSQTKRALIRQIEELANEKLTTHNEWQSQMQKVENLRNEFLKVGRVPDAENKEIWDLLHSAIRTFYSNKNTAYKAVKEKQQSNLEKKTALLEKANELKDRTDFDHTTPLIKKLQAEWKTIGFVNSKQSKKIWEEFNTACNFYFDRFKAAKSVDLETELEAFEKKSEILEMLKNYEFTGNHKEDLEVVRGKINEWKTIGKVPYGRRHIDAKFNKLLDSLFEKLNLSRKETELVRYENRITQLKEASEGHSLEKEQFFIRKKIEEVQSGIFQLENNIQFISSAKKDNPLVKEVQKNIERHKDELKLWKEKLARLKE